MSETLKGVAVSESKMEIVIQGTLGDALNDAIDDFEVRRMENGHTHLVGPVPDQARLQGILSLFSSLNIQLVSVNPVAD